MGKILKVGCLGLATILGLLIILGVVAAIVSPKATVTTGSAPVQTSAPVPTTAPGATPAAKAPAPTTAPAPVATAAPKVGDTVTLGNWSYIVTKAEKPGQHLDTGNQFIKLDALGTWVAVYMTLKNVGKENFPINTSDFNLADGAGIQSKTTDHFFEMNEWVKGKKLQPLGQQIPPGVSFDTAILFDVNPQATGFKLNLVQARTAVALGL